MIDSPGDVGGWFRTAREDAAVLTDRTTWAPTGDTFGRVSHEEDLTGAFELFRGRPTMVLTGAGMSTGSGLPDYRGKGAVPRSPMTYQEFVSSDLSRRRYWARSTVGWGSFGKARPNPAHLALAELGRLTPFTGIVTQNVDRLHQAAGSSPVIDLHGNLERIVCLACQHNFARGQIQTLLLALNPDFVDRLPQLMDDSRTAPDGDAEVDRTDSFNYPACPDCGGVLKPDVVFFGENARRGIVEGANALLEGADVLLVLGTSLTVMSGLRFLRRSVREGREVIVVNDGPTRGDDLATLRLHGRLEPVLSHWVGLAR